MYSARNQFFLLQVEYAVKIIDKTVPTHSRSRVFKEIDLFHHCQVTPETSPRSSIEQVFALCMLSILL